MKIRIGFVSNSSSSSFVFALPSKPQSIEELKNMLFDSETKIYLNPYHDNYEGSPTSWPTETIAERVFSSINNSGSQDLKQIEEALIGYEEPTNNLIARDYYLENNMTLEERWTYWDKTSIIEKNQAYKKRIEFMTSNIGKEIYHINISDDSIMGSAMEHGDLFNRIQHIRISNH